MYQALVKHEMHIKLWLQTLKEEEAIF